MKFLTSDIFQPLFRRIGTVVGAALVAYGVTSEIATLIESGLVAALGVAFDLTLSNVSRRK